MLWFYKNKNRFLSNIIGVLRGKKSWIGYKLSEGTFENLPKLNTGVLSPADIFPDIALDEEKIKHLNILYARDYSLVTDAEIILKAWKKLDQ